MRKIGLFLCAMLVGIPCCQAGMEVVFDNFENTGSSLQYVPESVQNEYGDEVFFGGTARTIERMDIECYCGITEHTPDKYAVVRIYQDLGVDTNSLPIVGDVLYKSEPVQAISGMQVISLEDIHVTIEEPNFIWTIQFYGLNAGDKDSGGVLMYQNPTVGASYSDILVREMDENYQPIGEFKAYRFLSVLGNFGVRVWASEAPELVISNEEKVEDGVQITVEGPMYVSFALECAPSLEGEWESVLTDVLMEKSVTYTIAREGFFRVKEVEVVDTQLVLKGKEKNRTDVDVYGTPGRGIRFLHSTNLVDWESVRTNYFVSPRVSFKDYTAITNKTQCFFATEGLEEDVPVEVVQIILLPEQESNLVRIAGPRGRKFQVSYQLTEGVWSKPQKGCFCFYPAYTGSYYDGLATLLFPHLDPSVTVSGEAFLPTLLQVTMFPEGF